MQKSETEGQTARACAFDMRTVKTVHRGRLAHGGGAFGGGVAEVITGLDATGTVRGIDHIRLFEKVSGEMKTKACDRTKAVYSKCFDARGVSWARTAEAATRAANIRDEDMVVQESV